MEKIQPAVLRKIKIKFSEKINLQNLAELVQRLPEMQGQVFLLDI